MITVVMTTYFSEEVPQRAEYAIESLSSLVQHLCYKDGLRLHVADDSLELGNDAATIMRLSETGWSASSYSNSAHRGIGASLNTAVGKGVLGTWMYTTDDWVLEAPLCLDGPAKLLSMGYDLVRLGPVHPDLQCVTRFQAGLGWWLDLLPAYGGFAFATRPFLATKSFWEKIGPFDEGLNSYETERLYAEKVAKSTVKLAYWGGVSLSGPWCHVGIENVGYKDV